MIKPDEQKFDARRLYRLLTFWRHLFLVFFCIGAGGYLAGFRIPKDYLPTDYKNSIRSDHEDLLRRFFKDDPRMVLTENAGNSLVKWHEAETRRRVQTPFQALLLFSFLLFIAVNHMRKEPSEWDNTIDRLPKFVADKIPRLIDRVKLSEVDSKGNETIIGIYRTIAHAQEKAQQRGAGKKVLISTDDSGCRDYATFLASLRKLCGSQILGDTGWNG